jgi:hypothetical protein
VTGNLVPMTEREARLLERTVQTARLLGARQARRRRVLSLMLVVLVGSSTVAVVAGVGLRDHRSPRASIPAVTPTSSLHASGSAATRPRFRFVAHVTGVTQVCAFTIGPPPAGSTTSITAAQAFQGFRYPLADPATAGPAIVEFAAVTAPAYGQVIDGKVKPVYSNTPMWVVYYANVALQWVDPVCCTSRSFTSLGTVIAVIDPTTGQAQDTMTC